MAKENKRDKAKKNAIRVVCVVLALSMVAGIFLSVFAYLFT